MEITYDSPLDLREVGIEGESDDSDSSEDGGSDEEVNDEAYDSDAGSDIGDKANQDASRAEDEGGGGRKKSYGSTQLRLTYSFSINQQKVQY